MNLRRISEEKASRGAWKEGGKKSQDTFLSPESSEDQLRGERGRIEKREVFNRSHVESIGKPVVEGGGEGKVAPRRRREIRLQMA